MSPQLINRRVAEAAYLIAGFAVRPDMPPLGDVNVSALYRREIQFMMVDLTDLFHAGLVLGVEPVGGPHKPDEPYGPAYWSVTLPLGDWTVCLWKLTSEPYRPAAAVPVAVA